MNLHAFSEEKLLEIITAHEKKDGIFGVMRGVYTEKRALRLLRTFPEIKNIKQASRIEDQAGVDLFVYLDNGFVIKLQIKCYLYNSREKRPNPKTRKRIRFLKEKGIKILCLPVDKPDSYCLQQIKCLIL